MTENNGGRAGLTTDARSPETRHGDEVPPEPTTDQGQATGFADFPHQRRQSQVVTRIPMRQLLKDVHSVIAAVERGERVQITSRGKVVLVAVAPDTDEQTLDELAAEGDIPADWRNQQAVFHRLLSHLPGVTAPAGPATGSQTLLADRYENADQ